MLFVSLFHMVTIKLCPKGHHQYPKLLLLHFLIVRRCLAKVYQKQSIICTKTVDFLAYILLSDIYWTNISSTVKNLQTPIWPPKRHFKRTFKIFLPIHSSLCGHLCSCLETKIITTLIFTRLFIDSVLTMEKLFCFGHL